MLHRSLTELNVSLFPHRVWKPIVSASRQFTTSRSVSALGASSSSSSSAASPKPPLMRIRRAAERGHANHGWLDSHHTFSFADYYDPGHMGFRGLRVINDDRVTGGNGFGTHSHRDMEIVSYVLEGALEHKDSMGTGSVISPGDVQRMSAGSGVSHSEYNASKTDLVHFLQIWIKPLEKGIAPGYEQKRFAEADKRGQLRLVASTDGRDGSVTVHADASIYAGIFESGESASVTVASGRGAWLHVASGEVKVGGQTLRDGDGASFEASSGPEEVEVEGVSRGEVLILDVV